MRRLRRNVVCENVEDPLHFNANAVEEWQYLLVGKDRPRLVKRYAGGEVCLYLQCRLKRVAGVQIDRRNVQLLESVWQVLGDFDGRAPSLRHGDAVQRFVPNLDARNDCVGYTVGVHVAEFMEETKRLRLRVAPSLVRLLP